MNIIEDTQRHIRALEMLLENHPGGYFVKSNDDVFVHDFKRLRDFIAEPVKGQLNPGVVFGVMRAQRWQYHNHAFQVANAIRDHERNPFIVVNARKAIIEEIARQRNHVKWLKSHIGVVSDES